MSRCRYFFLFWCRTQSPSRWVRRSPPEEPGLENNNARGSAASVLTWSSWSTISSSVFLNILSVIKVSHPRVRHLLTQLHHNDLPFWLQRPYLNQNGVQLHVCYARIEYSLNQYGIFWAPLLQSLVPNHRMTSYIVSERQMFKLKYQVITNGR